MFDRLVFLGRVPAEGLGEGTIIVVGGVFGADAVAPCQLVVDLEEVVIAQDGRLGLYAAEEVHHALFEFGFETGHVAAGVDFAEGHPEFVG